MSNVIRNEIEEMLAAGNNIDDIMAILAKTVDEVKDAEKQRKIAEEEAKRKAEKEIDEYLDIVEDAMAEIAKRKYAEGDPRRESVTQCFEKESMKTMFKMFDTFNEEINSIFKMPFETKAPKTKVSESDADNIIKDFLDQLFS